MQNLSFCIQGPVARNSHGENLTQKLIASIKHFYPNSPIIFSTWESETIDFLEGINLVLSKDPGSGLRYKNRPWENNINRQIISTCAGLNAVTTRFVVKMRSDLLVENRRLEKIVEKLPKTPSNSYSIFENYIIVLDRLTFNPNKKLNPLLHVTDMLQAGVTKDVRRMWDIPLMTSAQENYYANVEPILASKVANHLPEFRAEQYFWNELIRKELGFGLDETFSNSLEGNMDVIELFDSNIIPFRFPTLGISIQKEIYKWSRRDSWITSIYAHTFFDWKKSDYSKLAEFDLPQRFLYWEIRGKIYGFLYRKGFNFPPDSKIQRLR
jgi:hypothetical protein